MGDGIDSRITDSYRWKSQVWGSFILVVSDAVSSEGRWSASDAMFIEWMKGLRMLRKQIVDVHGRRAHGDMYIYIIHNEEKNTMVNPWLGLMMEVASILCILPEETREKRDLV